MKLVTSTPELRLQRACLPEPLGFVPTMGFLHAGHISLVERARQECASVAASIFVNPTQFGPNEDLAKYPRNLPRDLAMLETAGVDLVWTPALESMYPPGYQTWVDVEALATPLEGTQRPGHFRGVTTVVAKLFNLIQPQRAYFGQKDAQQVAVIQRMTVDLDFPIEIITCPTLREPDGLAMSSRNAYLNPEERAAATILQRSLEKARKAFLAGERDAEVLCALVRASIQTEPLARLQYVSCADAGTLLELDQISAKSLLSMAVFIGKTRLIDNLILE